MLTPTSRESVRLRLRKFTFRLEKRVAHGSRLRGIFSLLVAGSVAALYYVFRFN